jgi:hypothetical protein
MFVPIWAKGLGAICVNVDSQNRVSSTQRERGTISHFTRLFPPISVPSYEPITHMLYRPSSSSVSSSPRFGKLAQCRRPNKIQGPTRPAINPPLVPKPIDAISEEGITRLCIDECEVGVEDTTPATFDICSALEC